MCAIDLEVVKTNSAHEFTLITLLLPGKSPRNLADIQIMSLEVVPKIILHISFPKSYYTSFLSIPK